VATTLDRYPAEDQEGRYKLPVETIPMFIFPHGIKIVCPSVVNERLNNGDAEEGLCPLPKFFTFNFTDSNGDFFYVASLRFYEPVHHSELENLFALFPSESHMYLHSKTFYCPKVIAVISTHPFYRSMRHFLDQIYSLSLGNSVCSIESFIASLVAAVPVPIRGGRAFHFVLDAGIIPDNYQTLPPIVFAAPKPAFYPLFDFDLTAPLRCFSIPTIVLIFSLLLQESRVVFIGSSSQLVTEVMESFRAFLFPLQW
jgi:hypothetical protein